MFWDKIRSIFFKAESGAPQTKFKRNLLILFAAGVFLMLFNYWVGGLDADRSEIEPLDEKERESSAAGEVKEKELVSRITSLLNQVEGVDNVAVYLTRESGPEKELAYDRDEQKTVTVEEDAEGGVRETEEKTMQDNPVILRDSREGEKPLVLVEHHESYRGVLVVAEGVQDSRRKNQVVEALKSLLGLPAHRITVLPRGG